MYLINKLIRVIFRKIKHKRTELVHEMLVLIALVSNDGSGEHLRMRRLARGLVARISNVCLSYADPESFVRGGPNFDKVFLVDEGVRIHILLKVCHHWPAI